MYIKSSTVALLSASFTSCIRSLRPDNVNSVEVESDSDGASEPSCSGWSRDSLSFCKRTNWSSMALWKSSGCFSKMYPNICPNGVAGLEGACTGGAVCRRLAVYGVPSVGSELSHSDHMQPRLDTKVHSYSRVCSPCKVPLREPISPHPSPALATTDTAEQDLETQTMPKSNTYRKTISRCHCTPAKTFALCPLGPLTRHDELGTCHACRAYVAVVANSLRAEHVLSGGVLATYGCCIVAGLRSTRVLVGDNLVDDRRYRQSLSSPAGCMSKYNVCVLAHLTARTLLPRVESSSPCTQLRPDSATTKGSSRRFGRHNGSLVTDP